jgi:hypothetical protein
MAMQRVIWLMAALAMANTYCLLTPMRLAMPVRVQPPSLLPAPVAAALSRGSQKTGRLIILPHPHRIGWMVSFPTSGASDPFDVVKEQEKNKDALSQVIEEMGLTDEYNKYKGKV